jgi:RNA polymerase sigma-19 factor, ECF subfamily
MPSIGHKTIQGSGPLPEEAVGAYRAELHRWLRRRLGDPDAADDVTQEVFLRLWRMDRGSYIRKPLSYLYGIAFHVIRELRQAERRAQFVSFDSETTNWADESLQNAVSTESDGTRDLHFQLQSAMDQLPSQYRTVLLLCKRDGMTYVEAAAASGLSVHTVEKYLVRARAKLMELTCDL